MAAGPVRDALMVPGAQLVLGPLGDPVIRSAFDALCSWIAQELMVLIEWAWSTLDSATTPHLTMVIYHLLPTIEGAATGTGIASGWSRSAVSSLYAAWTAEHLAASAACSPTRRPERPTAPARTEAPAPPIAGPDAVPGSSDPGTGDAATAFATWSGVLGSGAGLMPSVMRPMTKPGRTSSN